MVGSVSTILRRASDDDYRALYGKEPPADWVGWVAERDGAVVAAAYVWVDQFARCWCGIDNARAMPLLMLHRMLRDVFAAMQQESIPALYCLCDERIPAASRWLFRLGFVVGQDYPGSVCGIGW